MFTHETKGDQYGQQYGYGQHLGYDKGDIVKEKEKRIMHGGALFHEIVDFFEKIDNKINTDHHDHNNHEVF